MPVWAHPRTSRPSSKGGMACTWMGVGTVYFSAATARRRGSIKSSESKEFKMSMPYKEIRNVDSAYSRWPRVAEPTSPEASCPILNYSRGPWSEGVGSRLVNFFGWKGSCKGSGRDLSTSSDGRDGRGRASECEWGSIGACGLGRAVDGLLVRRRSVRAERLRRGSPRGIRPTNRRGAACCALGRSGLPDSGH